MASRVRVIGPHGQTVAVVDEAATAWSRMVGLLLHSRLPEGGGLLLAPAWSIHTWFMRFPIDVIFLDDDGRVLRLFPDLPPWRLASGTRKARTVIELPAGTIARANLRVGDQLTWVR